MHRLRLIHIRRMTLVIFALWCVVLVAGLVSSFPVLSGVPPKFVVYCTTLLFGLLGMFSMLLTTRRLIPFELSVSILYTAVLLILTLGASSQIRPVPLLFAAIQGLGVAIWTLKEAEIQVERLRE